MDNPTAFGPPSLLRVKVTWPSVTEASPEAGTVLAGIGMYKVVRYQSQPGNSTKYFLLNPAIDHIEIRSAMPLTERTPNFILGRSSTYRADLLAITRVTMYAGHLHGSLDWVVDSMDSMSSLRQLTVWDRTVDRSLNKSYRVHLHFGMYFEDVVGYQITPLFENKDGDLIYGNDAITRISSLIDHRDGTSRLTSLWNLFHMCRRVSTFVSPSFVVDVKCWPDEECQEPCLVECVSPNLKA